MSWVSPINLTLLRATLEEETSIVQIGMSVEGCLDCQLIQEGPAHYEWHQPQAVGLGCSRELSEHKPRSE